MLQELHVGHAVVDFTPATGKLLWANDAYCVAHDGVCGMTREQLFEMDLYRGRSEADVLLHKRIHEVVQLENQCTHDYQTIDAIEKPVKVFVHCRPVPVRLDTAEEKIVCLMSFCPGGEEVKPHPAGHANRNGTHQSAADSQPQTAESSCQPFSIPSSMPSVAPSSSRSS